MGSKKTLRILYTIELFFDISNSIMEMNCELVIPIRSFKTAKTRLKDVLSPNEIRSLTQQCLTKGIDAAKKSEAISDIILLTQEKEVSDFATEKGIECYITSDGLNESLNLHRKRRPSSNLIVAMGDLFFVEDFDLIIKALSRVEFVIACDRHRRGSNVLGLREFIEFDFQFGIDSYQRHTKQCISRHYSFETIKDPKFCFDVDEIDDLNFLQKKWGQ